MIEKEVENYIKKQGGVFFSDIARKFKISNETARDIAKRLEKNNKVKIINKGIAKLVLTKSGEKYAEK